ncbi:MAG TPA: hypothetical protein VIY69_11720 [Candidatus Acidoferrales bacterium]
MTTGTMAQSAILKYGGNALADVMQQLDSPDPLVRASALNLSLTILERSEDLPSQARASELIRSALADDDGVVRRNAVMAIECLDERQTSVPTLQEIAKTDPFKLPGRAPDGGDGDEFYPVRYDARRVLRDIQDNAGCTR